MTESLEPAAEMESLLAAAVDGPLTDADRARLGHLLGASGDARESYVEHVILHAMLRWVHASPLGVEMAGRTASPHAEWRTPTCGQPTTKRRWTMPCPIAGTVPIFVSAKMGLSPLAPALFAPVPFFANGSFRAGWQFLGFLLAGRGDCRHWDSDRVGVPSAGRPGSVGRSQPSAAVPVGTVGGSTAGSCRPGHGDDDCTWANPHNVPVGFEKNGAGTKIRLGLGV